MPEGLDKADALSAASVDVARAAALPLSLRPALAMALAFLLVSALLGGCASTPPARVAMLPFEGPAARELAPALAGSLPEEYALVSAQQVARALRRSDAAPAQAEDFAMFARRTEAVAVVQGTISNVDGWKLRLAVRRGSSGELVGAVNVRAGSRRELLEIVRDKGSPGAFALLARVEKEGRAQGDPDGGSPARGRRRAVRDRAGQSREEEPPASRPARRAAKTADDERDEADADDRATARGAGEDDRATARGAGEDDRATAGADGSGTGADGGLVATGAGAGGRVVGAGTGAGGRVGAGMGAGGGRVGAGMWAGGGSVGAAAGGRYFASSVGGRLVGAGAGVGGRVGATRAGGRLVGAGGRPVGAGRLVAVRPGTGAPGTLTPGRRARFGAARASLRGAPGYGRSFGGAVRPRAAARPVAGAGRLGGGPFGGGAATRARLASAAVGGAAGPRGTGGLRASAAGAAANDDPLAAALAAGTSDDPLGGSQASAGPASAEARGADSGDGEARPADRGAAEEGDGATAKREAYGSRREEEDGEQREDPDAAAVSQRLPPAPPPSMIELSFGPRVMFRTFAFTDNVSGLPGYTLPGAAAVAGDAELYPIARSSGPIRHVGFAGHWESSVGAKTAGRAGERSHTTSARAYRVGARLRLPSSGFTTVIGADYGEHRFAMEVEGAMPPNVTYTFLRPSLSGRVQLGSGVALALTAAYLHVLDVGGLGNEDRFPRLTARGAEVSAGVGYAIDRELELGLAGDLRHYAHAMHVKPGDPWIVGGALDLHFGLTALLTYRVH